MYAVFATGGKQYRAATGDVLQVEKLEADQGATIELDQVLMVGEGADVHVGTPLVDGATVTARVVEHGRDKKIRVIKFKRRKGYEKQQGHRQYFTRIEITGIDGPGAQKKTTKKKAAARKAAAAEEPAASKDEAQDDKE